MEKYGVEVDQEKEKTASKDDTCPKCGSKMPVSNQVNIPKCDTCGTEPFEKTKDAEA